MPQGAIYKDGNIYQSVTSGPVLVPPKTSVKMTKTFEKPAPPGAYVLWANVTWYTGYSEKTANAVLNYILEEPEAKIEPIPINISTIIIIIIIIVIIGGIVYVKI